MEEVVSGVWEMFGVFVRQVAAMNKPASHKGLTPDPFG